MKKASIYGSVLFILNFTSVVLGETIDVPKDHKTIQAAINASTKGDIVLVQPGTYSEFIHLKDGIIVKSAGDDSQGKNGLKRAEATVINGSGAGVKGPSVKMAEAATLDGFTITNTGVFDQKEYEKHYLTQGENLPDERGAVGLGDSFPALLVSNVTAIVKNNIVHDNGHAGIGCIGKRNSSMISRNVCYRNMGGGIGISNEASPTVQGNRCYNNLRSGIGSRTSAGIILENECFDNVRAGIGVREGAKPIIRGNKCYKNQRAGIGCRMEGTSPYIEDNDCFQNKMAGIGTRDGATAIIRGNRCYENTLAGIGSMDSARPIIFGNKCHHNKDAGIGTQLSAKAFIANNECYDNEKAGIGQQSDSETIICGNHVYNNKLAGIGFDECKSGRSTVLNNKVVDNAKVAVGIHGGWKVRMAGNEFSRKDGLPPMIMVFKGSEVDFSENTITGSGVAAIRTEGIVRILNNKFNCPLLRKAGPPQFAVWGLPGAEIVFTGNRVEGWRNALNAEKASVIASYNTISDFWQTGIRITDPTRPVVAIGNIFKTNLGNAGVSITGENNILDNNRVEKVEKQK